VREVDEEFIYGNYTCRATNQMGVGNHLVEMRRASKHLLFSSDTLTLFIMHNSRRTFSLHALIGIAVIMWISFTVSTGRLKCDSCCVPCDYCYCLQDCGGDLPRVPSVLYLLFHLFALNWRNLA